MKNVLRTQKGFTLIELMIVVAIIGILAAVAIPQYQNFTKKSKASEAKVILDAIITSEAAYYAEQDTMTQDMGNIGDPDGPAVYYTYAADAALSSRTVITIVAMPTSDGIAAGLLNGWSMTYRGVSGDKTKTFPPEGF